MSLSLSSLLFWSSAACCLIAQALIVRSVLRVQALPQSRPELPRSRSGVELFWALVPAVALAVLFFFTWRAIEQRASHEHHSSVAAMDVAR